MPLYTYKCKKCGHLFEVHQRMTDDPLEACPVCSGEVRRVINSVGVVFKGKGFYVTDNRKSATLPSSSGESTKTSSTPSGEGDAKPSTESKAAETKASESKSVEKGK